MRELRKNVKANDEQDKQENVDPNTSTATISSFVPSQSLSEQSLTEIIVAATCSNNSTPKLTTTSTKTTRNKKYLAENGPTNA
ncbi:unnamed protein product, partial [Rotaria sordida]